MEYFAGLDVSMQETRVCVVDRDGSFVCEARVGTDAQEIAATLVRAPRCKRVIFESGRMAPILYHGLVKAGVAAICIESRHAYQALKSLGSHKTDRNDARRLAHLARTGFYKPVHVKSLSAHAIRGLIIARKKLIGSVSRWRTRSVDSRSCSEFDCLAHSAPGSLMWLCKPHKVSLAYRLLSPH